MYYQPDEHCPPRVHSFFSHGPNTTDKLYTVKCVYTSPCTIMHTQVNLSPIGIHSKPYLIGIHSKPPSALQAGFYAVLNCIIGLISSNLKNVMFCYKQERTIAQVPSGWQVDCISIIRFSPPNQAASCPLNASRIHTGRKHQHFNNQEEDTPNLTNGG